MRGQAGVCTSRPRLSKRFFQPSQLRGVSQRPWTRTMGGAEGASGAMGLLVVDAWNGDATDGGAHAACAARTSLHSARYAAADGCFGAVVTTGARRAPIS